MAHQEGAQIKYRELQLFENQVLGQGSYGRVCKAKYDNLLCAAKIIHHHLCDDNAQLQVGPQREHRHPVQRFERECDFMKAIRHPNIVQFLGIIEHRQLHVPVLLTELMDCSLTNFLDAAQCAVPYCTQVNFCHDIALALAFLHSNSIIHRDLSSNNVLLIGDVRAKVTDFGMAKFIYANPRVSSMTRVPGTDVYMPPEAVEDNPAYTEKIDSFSFGVTVLQILTRKFPEPGNRVQRIEHPDHPNSRIQRCIPEVKRRQGHISEVNASHPLLSIVFECIKDNPDDRPTSHALCCELEKRKDEPQYSECRNSGQPQEPGVPTRPSEERSQVDELQQRIEELRQELEQKIQLLKEISRRVGVDQIDDLQQRVEDLNQQLEQKTQLLEEIAQMVGVGQIDDLRQCIEDLNQQLEEKTQMLKEMFQKVTVEQLVTEIQKNQASPNDPLFSKHSSVNITSTEKSGSSEGNTTASTQSNTSASVQSNTTTNVQSSTRNTTAASTQSNTTSAASANPNINGDNATERKLKFIWKKARNLCFHQLSREMCTAAACDGKIYFNQRVSRKVYVYNPADESWSQLPSCPYKFSSLAVVQGSLTAVGGETVEDKKLVKALVTLVDAKHWTVRFSPMLKEHCDLVTVWNDSILVVAGGIAYGIYFSKVHSADVEVLDIYNSQWCKAVSLPVRPKEGDPYDTRTTTAALCGNCIYILADNEIDQYYDHYEFAELYVCTLNTLFKSCEPKFRGEIPKQDLSISGTKWRHLTNCTKTGLTLVSYNDQLLTIGGKITENIPEAQIFRVNPEIDDTTETTAVCVVSKYNPEINSWEDISNSLSARFSCFTTVFHNSEILVIGGYNSVTRDDHFRLNDYSDIIEVASEDST